METESQSQFKNNLLLRMSPHDRGRLALHLEFVTLPRGLTLAEPGMAVDFTYFLENGIGSVVVASTSEPKAEIGLFGREGLIPTSAVSGVPSSPYHVFMQVSGSGHRIANAYLQAAMAESVPLRNLLARYLHSASVQVAYTAFSNATQQIEARLARWLLMCHDRSETDDIALTHEFIGVMLAVRRQSVTTTLHVLEGKHLISASRAFITIRNRAGLRTLAGDTYGRPERDYETNIGGFQTKD